jgi:hypothetical protein
MSKPPESDDRDTSMTGNELGKLLGAEFKPDGNVDGDSLYAACFNLFLNPHMSRLSTEVQQIVFENAANLLEMVAIARAKQGKG